MTRMVRTMAVDDIANDDMSCVCFVCMFVCANDIAVDDAVQSRP